MVVFACYAFHKAKQNNIANAEKFGVEQHAQGSYAMAWVKNPTATPPHCTPYRPRHMHTA